VLRSEIIELASEFPQGIVGVAGAEVTGLLECGQRFRDARESEFVGGKIEIVYSVVDKLRWLE